MKHLYLARFTLQAHTPWSLSSGSADGVFDTTLVRDANGLPAIPGSTLAGVLRHLYQDDHGQGATDALFGFQSRGTGHDDNGAGSSVQVAWGCVLDSHGQPVEGLAAANQPQRLRDDPLLAALLTQADAPISRNRVRVGVRGAAADTGKFDRAILPAGHRFAGEISLWSDQASDPRWQRLLALLGDPRLRLGASTRSGLGATRLVRLWQRHYDLAGDKDAADFRSLSPDIAAHNGLHQADTAAAHLPDGWLRFDLQLTAEDFWRIGQGNEPCGNYATGKTPNALPLVEECIQWDKHGQGYRRLNLALLPASSLKGALAHRVAYYANCLDGNWADAHPVGEDWDKSDPDNGSPAVRELFGYSRDCVTDGEPAGQAGRLYIDDVGIDVSAGQVAMMMHNAIDRFTGGVRDRLLFGEELLWQTRLNVTCLFDTRQVSKQARHALQLALNDLASGRLSLGAGSGRGHGRFHAKPDSLPGLRSDTHPEHAQ